MPKVEIEELHERNKAFEERIMEKINDIGYDSEDESQNNESIDDISGEVGGESDVKE